MSGTEKNLRSKASGALCARINTLINEYKKILLEFSASDVATVKRPVIPRPVAYEFQHAIVHLAHSYLCSSIEGRWRQFGSAIGHLERGLLDAYKTLLFQANCHNRLGETEHFGDLIRCRLSEYAETGNARIEEKIGRNNHAIMRYSTFYKKVIPAPKVNIVTSCPQIISNESGQATKQFFALIHEWGQCELILSAFMRDKHIPTLQAMMTAVLHNLSVAELESAINELYHDIAHAAMSGVNRSAFIKTISSDRDRYARYEKAKDVMLNLQRDYTAIKEFVKKDVFTHYKINLKNCE